MPPQSLFAPYDRALGGRLAEIMRRYRQELDLSFNEMALSFYDEHGINLSPETWRRWYSEYVETAA